MRNLLLEITPIDPSTGLTTTLNLASIYADPSGTMQLGGKNWLPCITKGPQVQLSWWSNGQPQPLDISYGQIEFAIGSALGNLNWPAYAYEGTPYTFWIGNLGDPFSNYKQVLSGYLGPFTRSSDQKATLSLLGAESVLAKTNLLTSTYAGTGGIEGPSGDVGNFKPYAIGNCINVTPVLLDANYQIYQVDGYDTCTVTNVYENALDLGPPVSTSSTTFAQLQGLTLADGQWASAPSLGLFRLANEPSGTLTADIGATSTVGAVITALLTKAGIASAFIDSTVAAATTPYCLFATSQITILDAIKDAAFAAGKMFMPDETGKFCLVPQVSTKTAGTLTSDRTTYPLVRPDTIVQEPASPPAWRVKIGHSHNWTPMTIDQISPAIAELGEDMTAVQQAAQDAQDAANQAQSDATAANTRLASMADDNVLDRTDKAQLIQVMTAINAEISVYQARATSLGITTELSTFNLTATALTGYINGLTPAYTDTVHDTPITGTVFRSYFTNYYAARQTLANAIAGYTTQRVPSNLVGIGSAGNIVLDPNFVDQSLWTVVGSNINFVTATQSITPAGVVTADTSSAADLATMGVVKATKSLGNGTAGRWGSPKYQLPGPGTYVGSIRILVKAGGSFGGSIGFGLYDKAGTQVAYAAPTISYASVGSDILFEATATLTTPAGAIYAALNPNFGGTGSNFYMGMPSIRPVSTPGLVNLADTSNMIPDADFLDPAITWGMTAAWTQLPNSTAGLGAGKNKLRLDTSKAGSCQTAKIPCGPNVSLYYSIYRNVVSGTTGQSLAALVAYDAAGNSLGYISPYFYDATGTSGRFANISKTPANTAAIVMLLYNYSGGDRIIDFSEPVVRKATTSGTDLVGSTGTLLTDPLIITGQGIAGGIVNQGTGATANNLAQLDAAASTKLTGIAAGATNTTTYSQSTAPTSPNNGDIWNDTSTNPVTIKVRVGGVWIIGATNVTNTSQITDGAGLGTTATWSGVIGTGKPADNATKTTTYSQSTAPSSPNIGDSWNDTSTNPPTLKIRVGSSWIAAANFVTGTNQLTDNAGLGTTATWTGVGSKPANIGALTGSEPIRNNDMSITAAGQLLTGGTPLGQVTIGGLGYVGDLRATRNDDATNMLRSPYSLDNVELSNGAVRQVNGSAGRPADNIRVYLPPSTTNYVACAWDHSTAVPVQPGDVLFYAHTAYRDSSTTDSFDAGYNLYTAKGSWIGGVDMPTTTMSSADPATSWVRKTSTITIPANAAYVQPYVIRPPSSGTGIYYVGEPYLGRSQQGADVTATNQVQVTYTTSKTIAADYLGNISSGVLPTTVPAPKVSLGGVDVTQANNVQYAIVNATGGCAGNVTVDTTNGSATKAVQVIGTGFNASGGYQLQITVNGYALPLISVAVTKKLGESPSGGGSGGGGGSSTSGSMSASGYAVYNTSFVQVGTTISNLTVASGKTASAAGGDDYSCLGGSTQIGNVSLMVKWQYSVAGANSWTDMGTAVTGVAATYNNKTGDESSGSVNCNQSVAPSAGSYDFRLMAAIASHSTGASGQFSGSGTWSVNIA